MPGHPVIGMHRPVCRGIRHLLAAFPQPRLHEPDLVRLRGPDAAGGLDQVRLVGAIRRQRSHFESLVVMRDHVLHEPHVGRRIARDGDFYRIFGTELARRTTGGARLDDRRLRQGNRGVGGHRRNEAGAANQSTQGIAASGHGVRSCAEFVMGWLPGDKSDDGPGTDESIHNTVPAEVRGRTGLVSIPAGSGL
jgi:hypothetical protein